MGARSIWWVICLHTWNFLCIFTTNCVNLACTSSWPVTAILTVSHDMYNYRYHVLKLLANTVEFSAFTSGRNKQGSFGLHDMYNYRYYVLNLLASPLWVNYCFLHPTTNKRGSFGPLGSAAKVSKKKKSRISRKLFSLEDYGFGSFVLQYFKVSSFIE